ncbi:S-adenosyl-L-methionine-dependent methyltransferase [Entophlyctis helioformis]|nr:S-adenosyl-L-methionine-dependent methyltransferase [Entophlyctis helioformis]
MLRGTRSVHLPPHPQCEFLTAASCQPLPPESCSLQLPRDGQRTHAAQHLQMSSWFQLPKASALYEPVLDTGYVPDFLLRQGIRTLLAKRARSLTYPRAREQIAIHTKEANEQHYEVPTEFFRLSLGKRFKYSACLFEGADAARTLDEAETAMLDLYVQRAGVEDGMRILDLGCGWGSLSLYLAERFPNARIVGLSNSSTQREYIMGQAEARGFKNVEIRTGDVAEYTMADQFDRIISIEMFEHMKNYESLFAKVSSWLVPVTGRLFVHVFAHKAMPYDFRTDEDNSWMAKYFFTGGTMPSQDLYMWFQKDLEVLQRWTINGKNYGQTSEEWLKLMDANKAKIIPLFEKAYGSLDQAYLWFHRWRLFYLSVAETFNYNNGEEWFVVHYLFRRK